MNGQLESVRKGAGVASPGGGGLRETTKRVRMSVSRSGNLQNTILSSVLNAIVLAWNFNYQFFIRYEISDSKLVLVFGSNNQRSSK